jgi:hypothetical protein
MRGRPIARIWNGHVPLARQNSFLDHLRATGVADASRVEGYLGSLVLRRVDGERSWFTLLTFWRDEAAVRGFAPDTTAVLYPGDAAFDLIPDGIATQSEIVLLEMDRCAGGLVMGAVGGP